MSKPPKPDPPYDHARAIDAPLQAQLDDYASGLGERRPRLAAAYQALVETLRRGDAGALAPREGDVMPPFLLPDDGGRLLSSAELLSRGPLVISFNRGSWCPFCWLKLSALNDHHAEIRRRGGDIVSITPDIATHGRQLRARLGLSFPMLTDLDNGYALELGLAVALSADIKANFAERGFDMGLFHRNDAWFVPIPATLVVGPEGVVRHAYVNPDFRQRLDARLIPGILAALA